MSEKLGRKIALYCVVIPQLMSWIFIYYARTPFYLIFARILGGTGMAYFTTFFLTRFLFVPSSNEKI
jgi:hypothetical protein